ncbi:hypothetical protein ACIA5C_11535 [Actinoplanes sp. NPDC051343]|uniref:hypothetical protein n=1 Tax=Actinoplanes sp. NPDC051343 TaxID=3363906 RepID=UPI00379F615E
MPISSSTSCQDGDTVTVTARPWSRRVITLTVTGQGRERDVVPAPLLQRPTAEPAPPLFRVSDVGQMFGRPVTASAIPWGTQYCAADNGKMLLMVQSVSGMGGRLAWRLNSARGVEHPAGFLINGDIGVYRTGDITVVANLTGDGRVARTALPWLMEQAMHRLRA